MANHILTGTIQLTAPGVQQTANTVTASVNQMNSALTRTAPAVQKTSANLTGLSRVIQDLPFGFIGIQNNLTQLVPSVGLLGLGLSAVTAAFTFAQVGLQNWSGLFPSANDRVKEQVKALNDYKQGLKDYVDVLDDINRARVLGNQAAQEELVKLKTLYDATQNQNISLSKRRELVDELQSQYPKTFANFRDEIILAGGAKSAYDKLSASILASARARAGQDILVDLQKDILANERQELDNSQQLSDLNQKILKLKESGAKFTYTSLKGEEQLTSEGAELNKLQNQYNDLLSEGTKIFKENLSLNERAKRITGEITSTVENNPDSLLNPTGNLPKEIKVKVKKVKIEPREILLPLDNITDYVKPDRIGKAFPKIKMDIPVEIRLKLDAFERERARIEAIQKDIQASMKDAAANIATAFGEGLGDLVSGKGIESAFKGIANVVGGFVSSLGQTLIKAAVATINFKKAFEALLKSPVAALAVGVGLVAIGQLIKNIAMPKIPGFAKGGVVPPGYPNDTFLARLTSGERIIPANQQYNALQPAMATGGGGQLSMRISGADLLVWLDRAQKRGGRY